MTNHWHVATGLAGYGPDASDGNWSTIDESDATGLADSIRGELQFIANFEREGAQAYADSEDYENAWRTMENANTLWNLAENFDNKRAQAPLYAGNPALWHETIYRMVAESFPVDFRDGNSRLYVWECSETDCHDEEVSEEPDTCLNPIDGHWYVITYGRARWEIHAPDCETCAAEREEVND